MMFGPSRSMVVPNLVDLSSIVVKAVEVPSLQPCW
jgi:hypothetical protein